MPIVPARVRCYTSTEAPNPQGRYVLYWMQMYRRLDRNFALEFAAEWAGKLRKPLVVYEGLKLGYPWANVRHHRFILEGMQANAREAKHLGLTYWPFVETPDDPGRGLLRRLSADAALVVSDAYPCFIVPNQLDALAARIEVPLFAIDGNSLVPLAELGAPISAAAHLRPRIHKAFATAWANRAAVVPELPAFVRTTVEPPFRVWNTECDLGSFLDDLPLDKSVPAVPQVVGGSVAAKEVLRRFVARKLPRYAEERSNPDAPERNPASGLSPYLRHGHISIQEVAEAVLASLGDWRIEALNIRQRGKRDGFFCTDANVNGFLDEALTWRDVGLQWHWHRRADTASLAAALPAWAMETLNKHRSDPREQVYTVEEFEAGATHDPLWNAAQRELVATGRIQNYLRMLWGKKVLEWSATPEEAYRTLVHLNNKYALDGRDPNSYTGILWCFGLFDRPWPPERPVYGSVRYMSSENTAKKFKLAGYYEWIRSLPTISAVRSGKAIATQHVGLFDSGG